MSLIWLYDLLQLPKVAIGRYTDLVVEDRLQDLETLVFAIEADDQKAPLLAPDLYVRYDDRIYRITELRQEREGSEALVVVTAEGRWTELSRRTRAGETSLLGRTNAQGLNAILAGTGWVSGGVPADPVLYSMVELDATVVALVRRWADITGTEVEWDTIGRRVFLRPQVGEDRGVGFRYGKNVRSISRRYEPPIATRLYPYGGNDLDISAVNPSGLQYIENYDWYLAQGLTLAQAQQRYRKDQVWSDQRYLVGVNLLDAAIRRLDRISKPIISYEMDVVDLWATSDGESAPLLIGDTVTVRDPTFSIDIKTRVVRLIRHPRAPWNDQIELEFLQRTLTDSELEVGGRTTDPGAVGILVDTNDEAFVVGSGTTLWGEIGITVTGQTTFVSGGTFVGVATGSGVVRFSMAIDGEVVGATFDFPFDAATEPQVEFSWPSFATGLDEGTYLVTWRAVVTSGAGTIAVAEEAARAWLLIRGAVGAGLASTPSQFLAEELPLIGLDKYIDLTGDDWTVSVTNVSGPDLLVPFSDTLPASAVEVIDLTETPWAVSSTANVDLVANTTESYGSGSSITTISQTVPAACDTNDLVVVTLMHQAGAGGITAPAGFTREVQIAHAGASGQFSEIWVKKDTLGDMASTSIQFTGAVAGPMGMMTLVLRDGVGVGVEVDDNNATTFTTPNDPGVEPFSSVTSTGIGRVALAFASCSEANASGDTTYTAPIGFTLLSRATVGDSPAHERNRMMVAWRKLNAGSLTGRTTEHGGVGTHDAGTIMTLFRSEI